MTPMEDMESWSKYACDDDLDFLRHYVAAVADALTVEQRRRLDELNRPFKGRPENEHLADEIRGTLIFQIEFAIPRCLWSSTFVTLMSFVEQQTFALCDFLQKGQTVKLRHQDLKGDGLRRARTYIEKVCNLPFRPKETTWQELMTMGQIRNVIVHRDGDMVPKAEAENTDKEIWRYIEANASKGISSIDNTNGLALSQDYCNHALAVIGNFFDEVFRGLSE
jgi:hypothetical protein